MQRSDDAPDKKKKRLVELYKKDRARQARRLMRQPDSPDLDDAIQEGYKDLLKSGRDLDEVENPLAYVHAVAVNAGRRLAKGHKIDRITDSTDPVEIALLTDDSVTVDFDEQLESDLLKKQLTEEIERLPEKERLVMKAWVKDPSLLRVARACSLTEYEARTLFGQAKGRLRATLGARAYITRKPK